MKTVESKLVLKMEKTEAPETKIGAIRIRETEPETELGTVVSIGPKVEGVEEGSKVLIYPKTGKKFKVEGEEYRLINISEVIVVL